MIVTTKSRTTMMTTATNPTTWRRVLVFLEAPPYNVRYLHGMKQSGLLSTRICKVDRSDGHRRGLAVDRATTDRGAVGDADGARASSQNASLFDFDCRFARQLRRCVCNFVVHLSRIAGLCVAAF